MHRLARPFVILASLAVISTLALVSVSATTVEFGSAVEERDGTLATEVTKLDRSTPWKLTERVALDFPTYHPRWELSRSRQRSSRYAAAKAHRRTS